MRPRTSLLALALVVAGCSTPAVGSTPPPTPTPAAPTSTPNPTVEPSTPTPSEPASPAAPTPTPTPKPQAALDLEPMTPIRVLVNGLAVRKGPGTDYGLLTAYRYPAVFVTDALRLEAGHYLGIHHGPVIVNGVPWLLVYNVQQPGESSDDTLGWDADGDEFHTDFGWIAAAGSDGSAYVEVAEFPRNPGDPVYGPGPEPYLVAHGSGSFTSDVLDVTSEPTIGWLAADTEGGSCTFTVAFESGDPLVDVQVNGAAMDSVFAVGVTGSMAVVVETDCSWSLTVAPAQG